MRVLVDTSIWSLALRKKTKTVEEELIVQQLSKLIRKLHVVMIGPTRQELLSGVSEKQRFELLKETISVFPDFETTTADYETAARFYNECRQNGIQGSHIDFLIGAIASNNDFAIFTLDKDFQNYWRFIAIQLVKVEN
jgi:predicted nucleic acid-binding protein